MVKQMFKKGDIVAIQGSVEWGHEGKVKILLGDHQTAYVDAATVAMVAPKFEVGDDVVIDTGAPYTIAAIHRDFAWVFSTVEGFDTVELSSLRRPDPDFDEVPEAASDLEEAK